MSTPNRLDATLTTETTATVLALLDDVQTQLPFLTDLAPEERQSLPKMGDKSRAFVERSLQLAQQDDSFLPRNLDLVAFARDLTLYQSLEPLRQRVAKLLELLDDTQTLVGSEAYLAALEVYASARRSGQGTGLDALIDRVGQRFAARRATDPTPTT